MDNIKLLYKKSDGARVIELYDNDGNYVRAIMNNKAFQSACFVNDKKFEMYSKYAHLYDVVNLFNSNIKTSLTLGGGGFSYPKYYVNKYIDKSMDVVEFDKEMVSIAYNYFYLSEVDQSRLNIIVDDAFNYINNCEKKYDSIFVDLYNNNMNVIPDAVTNDTTLKLKNILNDDGILSFNYIHIIGDEDKLENYYKTLKNYFKNVKGYITDSCFNETCGNIFIVASDKELKINPNDFAIELDIETYTKGKICK